MTVNEIKDGLMRQDKEIVCDCLASIIHQLIVHRIRFDGYEENEPLEHRAKLDFSGLASVEVLIHYFQVEINNCKRRLESDESTCFNGVDCGNFEIARELNKAHIRFCERIINQLKRGYFK